MRERPGEVFILPPRVFRRARAAGYRRHARPQVYIAYLLACAQILLNRKICNHHGPSGGARATKRGDFTRNNPNTGGRLVTTRCRREPGGQGQKKKIQRHGGGNGASPSRNGTSCAGCAHTDKPRLHFASFILDRKDEALQPNAAAIKQ